MQRWQCPIHHGTLETFIWSIMLKILSFSLVQQYLILIISKCFLAIKIRKSIVVKKITIEKNQFSKLWTNSYLIKQRLCRCESDISIFAIYAYSPFNVFILFSWRTLRVWNHPWDLEQSPGPIQRMLSGNINSNPQFEFFSLFMYSF